MIATLSVLFGSFVGFALGLTGGGGSLLAVPLLVYGLSIPPHEAFGISLAAVGGTALIGLGQRIYAGEVEFGTGFLFALAGMTGAPVGIWVARKIPETVLLVLFAVLMLFIAGKMWREASSRKKDHSGSTPPTCEREESGQLKFTSKCALLLIMVGIVTGFLSGMFGVGGGVVIVPALVLFSEMPIRRAVGTSLLVIVLVSLSGVVSHFFAGDGISLEVTGLFVIGGVFGLALGNTVSRRISGAMLQRVFAVGILVVAAFIVVRTLT